MSQIASPSTNQEKLLIDIGSTYFKVCSETGIEQHFRDFNKSILDDLTHKCGQSIELFNKKDIHICSSANGGLSTLIIGVTNSFSLKYATNIAFNSGINIIDTVLFQNIEEYTIPSDLIDVVIIVGGINSNANNFSNSLFSYLDKLKYSNIVFVGSKLDEPAIKENIENVVVFTNFHLSMLLVIWNKSIFW